MDSHSAQSLEQSRLQLVPVVGVDGRRPRVVIVGAGFVGLTAATRLAKAPLDITLIDFENHPLFQPLLYQVATAGLSPADGDLGGRGRRLTGCRLACRTLSPLLTEPPMSKSATPSLPVLVPLIEAGMKQLGANKVRRRPGFDDAPVLRKPDWIRVRIPVGNAVATLKSKLRENHLVTVCEDAAARTSTNAGTPAPPPS